MTGVGVGVVAEGEQIEGKQNPCFVVTNPGCTGMAGAGDI